MAVAVVFVHGIFSNPDRWLDIIEQLRSDDLASTHSFHCFGYDSPKYRANPVRRIPSLADLAAQLETWIASQSTVAEAEYLILVGHSLGGLIIQRLIVDMLQQGRGLELQRVRSVVLLATPNHGSQLLLNARKFLSPIWKHTQETEMRPLDTELESIRRVIMERVVYALGVSESKCYIPFHVFAGSSDRVVPLQSARATFPRAGVLPGDHFGILNADSPDAQVVVALRRIFLSARLRSFQDITVIAIEELNPKDTDDVEQVVRLQHERFTPEAHMDATDLIYALENYYDEWGFRAHCLVARMDGSICGFLLFSETDVALVAGYLTTSRSSVGTFVTEKLIARLQEFSWDLGGRPIVFEVRDPLSAGAKKKSALARIRLFERYGARIIDSLEFEAPDMHTFPEERGVLYRLMYGLPGSSLGVLGETEVRQLIDAVYRVCYECWFKECADGLAARKYIERLKADRLLGISGEYELSSHWNP